MKKILLSSILGLSVTTIQAVETYSPYKVIGDDTRVEVTDSTTSYYRSVGQVGNFCTATLIDRRHVLTAAHCVYNGRSGRWYDETHFSPGRTGLNFPFAAYNWTDVYIPSEFAEDKDGYDFAIIKLAKDVIKDVPAVRFADSSEILSETDTEVNLPIQITGYPGDKPDGTMWTASDCTASVVGPMLSYVCDTAGGMSGSAVVAQKDGEKYIVGVHVHGLNTHNMATLLDEEKLARVRGWVNGEEVENTLTNTNTQRYFSFMFFNYCFNREVEYLVVYKNLEGEWASTGWQGLSFFSGMPKVKTNWDRVYTYARTKDGHYTWSGSDYTHTEGGETVNMKAQKTRFGLWENRVIDLVCGPLGSENDIDRLLGLIPAQQ